MATSTRALDKWNGNKDIEQIMEIDRKVDVLNARFDAGRDTLRAHGRDPVFVDLVARHNIFVNMKVSEIKTSAMMTECITSLGTHCDEMSAYLDSIGVPRLQSNKPPVK